MCLENNLYAILCGFLFLFGISKTYSQEKPQVNIASKNAYAEKIYLQPVSTVFTTDKTIWFKAIVTDLEHLPTKLSAVLHVDLIDFDENIIDSKLLKIENGIADGYFDLNEELPSGRYLIRAYTKWNKNFGSEFISQTYVDVYAPKEIKKEDQAIRNITLQETENEQYQISAKAYPELLNPKFKGKLKMYIHTENKIDSLEVKKDEDNIYSFSYLLPKNAVKARLELQLDSIRARNHDYKQFSSYSKTVAVNKEYLDLQFFPEGGKLVDGLTSKLAFKALDYNNKGKQITGTIVDEKNKIITTFKSNSLGMGTTNLTPEFQKSYYAVVKGADGVEYKYPLPNINPTGIVLNVKEIEEFIVIGLKTKETTEDVFHVNVQARGVEHDSFYLQFKNESCSGGIEKSKLPEGIVKFTITNQANQIVAERLFFNVKEKQRINISTSLNKPTYKQRDKTVVTINTTAKDSNAIKSNLSVLVINKEQLGKKNSLRSNILSYFLLNSELKGTIENPNEYFNKKNKTRKQDIDALLLTQGWSNYKYENTEFNTDFEFLPEQALTLSGNIKNQWFSKRELKKQVELTAIYGPLNVATQQIDSTGDFKMRLEDYYKDEFKVMLQTKDEKGNKKDYTIELDTYQSPEIYYKKEETVQLADGGVSSYVKENIIRKQKEEKLKPVKGAIELEEVELTGYNMTPQRQKMMDLHGAPDLVIENEELLSKEKKWHSGLFSLLQSSYPDDIEVKPTGVNYNSLSEDDNLLSSGKGTNGFSFLQAKVYGGSFTFIVIDGIPVELLDYPYIESLPIKEIKSFELIRNPKNSFYYKNQVFQAPFDNEEINVLGFMPDSTSPLYVGLDGVGVYENPMIEGDYILKITPKVSIISIYTYAGKGLRSISRNKGVETFSTQGFAPKREFYSPKYDETTENDWNVPDVRSVVHWSPNVITDEYGEAKVEFYNADNTGEMLIVIEGITKNGALGYYETSYTIEEK